MPLNVLLDMDPGVDDALALLLAVRSPELDIKAVTVCSGNAGVVQCGLNALKTLAFALPPGASAPPVALGASRPLSSSALRGAVLVHGADGLGEIQDRCPDPSPSQLHPDSAVNVITEFARGAGAPACGQRVTLIATGPLTNVALAMSRDPEAMRFVDHIYWMGGAYEGPGNVTPVAEFNAYFDPAAASEVLSFGVPVTAIGLNVTHRCPLLRSRLREARDSAPSPLLDFAWMITERYFQFHLEQEGEDFCYLHDPLAVAIAIWPDLVAKSEAHKIEVVTQPGLAYGMTIADHRPRNPWANPLSLAALERIPPADRRILGDFGLIGQDPHVSVVTEIHVDAFIDRLIQRLSS